MRAVILRWVSEGWRAEGQQPLPTGTRSDLAPASVINRVAGKRVKAQSCERCGRLATPGTRVSRCLCSDCRSSDCRSFER